MAQVTLKIEHPAGLHARPAALFVRTAAGYQASIEVANLTRDADRSADAKSIISLMTLGIEYGHEIEITASGDDEDEAIAGLTELVTSNFGESAA